MDAYFRKLFLDTNPNRRYPNYTQLGRLFGVSADTAKRDIIVMQDRFELPLAEFKERGGWGYWKLPPRLGGIWMEEGELLIVAASWGALDRRSVSGSDIGPKVRKVMEKLMNALGHDLAFDFQVVSERIAFRSSGYHSAIDIATFETVIYAVLAQHELRFTYHKQARGPDGGPSAGEVRYVQPRCMVCVDHSAWYLFADDPARPEEEPRTFALFRMSEVVDTGRKFEPAESFALEAILRDSLGIDRSGPTKTVELLFDPEVARYVEEHFWHATEQFGIADDGRLLLTMTVAINPELESKIHRWEPNVEVINPPELRDKFARAAFNTAARYTSGA